jgi:thiol:disulfide interchange protein DsbD
VKVALLADRATIRPGESFSLGVRLSIESDWHVYWENHGDSGLPTRVKVTGPAGFTLGEPRFPGPEREVAEGDIVCYVHRGEILLVVDGRAPDTLPDGMAMAAFSAEASWLVCTEACYPGSGRAALELPLAAAEAPVRLVDEERFAKARARLPKPWTELPGATLAWSGDDRHPVLTVRVENAGDLELFPLGSETTSLEERSLEREGSACWLTARLRFRKADTEPAPRLRGVLRVRNEQGESFYSLDSSPERPDDGVRTQNPSRKDGTK